MPTYEYDCSKCNIRFEVIRKFSETGGNVCPRCGGEGQRVYFAPHLVFKGPGFYVTDSRTEVDPEIEHRKKEKEAAEKPAEIKSDSKETDKSKPVTGAEAAKPAGADV